MLISALAAAGIITLALLIAAGLLHLLKHIGLAALGRWFCKAPGLDLWIAYFTVAPLFVGPMLFGRLTQHGADQDAAAPAGWVIVLIGLAAGIAGQVLAVVIWTALHELAHRDAVRGPRIVTQLNRTVGPVRNHVAVWWTAWAVPLFAMARIVQYLVYPPLTWLIRLPKYRTAEWVNVSRHKFEGLVGHDLIWCLYCDWMTGVWSLGSEMLRNVESFWCPIRFRSDKKCENCQVDFPDLNGGWAPSDGTMADAVEALEKHYPGPNGVNSWFGHTNRTKLTREGETIEESSGTT